MNSGRQHNKTISGTPGISFIHNPQFCGLRIERDVLRIHRSICVRASYTGGYGAAALGRSARRRSSAAVLGLACGPLQKQKFGPGLRRCTDCLKLLLYAAEQLIIFHALGHNCGNFLFLSLCLARRHRIARILTEHHMSFGVMRVTGTLAFGVIAFLMSWLYSKNEQTLFTAYAALALICVVTALRAPRVKGHAKKSEKYSLRPIFADRRLMLYIAANAVSQFTWMCYLNNFPTYLVEDRGAPQWLWGMNVFVTILGEIPFFLCIDRLFRRFSARVLLAGALTLSSLRCFALVFSGTAVPLLTTALLTGFAPTVLIYIAARHINDHVPQELRASGQNVMYALTYGLPRFLAGIVGGYVLTYSGVPQLMMMCGIVFMTASVIFMISEKKLPLYDENLK